MPEVAASKRGLLLVFTLLSRPPSAERSKPAPTTALEHSCCSVTVIHCNNITSDACCTARCLREQKVDGKYKIKC